MDILSRSIAATTFFLLASSPVASYGEDAGVLKNIRFTSPQELGLNISQYSGNGNTVAKIVTGWPTTVNLGIYEKDINGASKLDYSAKVKTQSLKGTVYLEMWVHFGEKQQYFSRGLDDMLEGENDWKTIHTSFYLQKEQEPDKVTLNLVINGTGTVFVENCSLAAIAFDESTVE